MVIVCAELHSKFGEKNPEGHRDKEVCLAIRFFFSGVFICSVCSVTQTGINFYNTQGLVLKVHTLIKEQNKKIYNCPSLFTSCCSTIRVCVCVSTCCVIGTSVVVIARVSKLEARGMAGPDQTRRGIVEARDTFVFVFVFVCVG